MSARGMNAVRRTVRQQAGLHTTRGQARRNWGAGGAAGKAACEALEGRVLLTAVVVNTIADQVDPAGSKTVSLRDAIALAAASATPTTITFDPKAFAAPQTISLNMGDLELSGTRPINITGSAAGVTVDASNSASNVLVVDKGVTATLNRLALTGGSSYLGGGIDNSGNLTLTDSTVSGNSTYGISYETPGNGGGIENESGAALKLVNSTVADNYTTGYQEERGAFAPGVGGGIDNNGALTITDCTLSGNSTYASTGAGIYEETGATVTIANSIVAGNGFVVGNNTESSDVGGAVKSLGFNLVGDAAGSSGWKTTDLTGTASKPLDPLLAPLGNFGGPTQTLVPLPASPAIDHGSNALIPAGVTTDQRGLQRIINGKVDIGAVETQLIHARIQVTGPAGQSGVEGKAVTVNLGSFATSTADAPYTVDVKWGDGSADDVFTVTKAGAIPGRSHIFTVAGTYHPSVAVIDAGGNGSNVASFAVKVADAPLSGSAMPQPGLGVGLPFDNQLATFTDADPNGTTSYYTATIAWGDGTTSAGTVGGQNPFTVNGTHIYTKAGVYHFIVTVDDFGGASVSLPGTATVGQDNSRVITVNTTSGQADPAGSKTLSLVDAVAMANASPVPTTIRFNPTVFAKPQAINLTASLELSGAQAINIDADSAGVTVHGNGGGPVFIIDANVSAGFTGLTLSGGGDGNGGVANDGALYLTRCSITGNATVGIFNNGVMTVADSTVSGNGTTAEDSGGITNSYAGTLTVVNSTISGNVGPGLHNYYGTARLEQSTVTGNVSSFAGGGIDNQSGNIKLTDCTVSGNYAYQYGGGIADRGVTPYSNTGTTTIANSIIAGNSARQNTDPDASGPVTSLGYNLVGQTDGSTGWVKTDLTGTSAKPLDAKLSLLGSYGGLTQTLVPLAGSPAINHGSNALVPAGDTTDQRGLPRVIGGVVDIGAVEVQPQTAAQLQLAPPATQAAVEGHVAALRLGSFTAAHAAGPYTVYVNWGDGTNDTELTVAAPGVLPVLSHTFAEEGTYTATVDLTDAAGDGPTEAHFAIKVADAPLTGSAAGFSVYSGTMFDGTVATFTDTDPAGVLADYTANVAWGDGSTSAGTITLVSGTTFTVAASHAYAKSGTYHFTVTVADAGGATVALGAAATVVTPSFVVNTASDQTDPFGSATVSLRDAIDVANDSVVPRAITFDPKVFATAKTITLDGTELSLFSPAGITITAPAAGLTLSGNNASPVLAIYGAGPASFSGLTITDGNTRNGNNPGGDGGGVFNSSDGVSFTHCTITGNTAGAGGGGIVSGGSLTLTDVTVSGNHADGNGNNIGPGGGGGIENYGTLTLNDSVVSGNTAAGDGGGIDNYGDPLTLANVTISGNRAGENGGGVENLNEPGVSTPPGAVSMTDVTLSGNTAVNGDGGGICNDNGQTARLVNVTITGNSAGGSSGGADGGGGGIFNQGVMTLADVTVFANNASIMGGGIDDPDGGLTLGNTIVAGDTAPAGPDAGGPVTSLGFNLVGKTNGSTGWTSHDLTGTSAKPLNAQLAPLANAGGFTQTLVPQAGSPAIGHGSVALVPSGVTTDQRGFPRIVNGKIDIGAVEV